MLPHDLTIAVIGGLILWFGWYGFNPASTLSLVDNAGVGRVATNTTLAACTGGLAAIFVMYFQTKKWDTTAIINGFLAGLVGITCPCYWVSGLGACVIGAVAGVIVIVAMELLEYFRIDDPVGAWPVHGACGIWGTLSLGLFASGQYQAAGSSPFGIPQIVANSPEALTGLFYGGGMQVLGAQMVGSVIICTATFASAMAMFAALNAFGLLRVSREGELIGLDVDQHGITAYPEHVISDASAFGGKSPEGQRPSGDVAGIGIVGLTATQTPPKRRRPSACELSARRSVSVHINGDARPSRLVVSQECWSFSRCYRLRRHFQRATSATCLDSRPRSRSAANPSTCCRTRARTPCRSRVPRASASWSLPRQVPRGSLPALPLGLTRIGLSKSVESPQCCLSTLAFNSQTAQSGFSSNSQAFLFLCRRIGATAALLSRRCVGVRMKLISSLVRGQARCRQTGAERDQCRGVVSGRGSGYAPNARDNGLDGTSLCARVVSQDGNSVVVTTMMSMKSSTW
jgi:hypothetical protein